jgi:hypothetical protein
MALSQRGCSPLLRIKAAIRESRRPVSDQRQQFYYDGTNSLGNVKAFFGKLSVAL